MKDAGEFNVSYSRPRKGKVGVWTSQASKKQKIRSSEICPGAGADIHAKAEILIYGK